MNEKQEKILLKSALLDRASRDEVKAIASVHIARQLTRIADRLELKDPIGIKFLDEDFIKNLNKAITAPPADDALVEAVSRFLRENAITPGVISVSKDTGKLTLDVGIGEVEKLMAAHKQAVT